MKTPKNIKLVQSKISFEPLKSYLPKEIEGIKNDLFKLISIDPKKALEKLNQLTKKYPDLPIVDNWRMIALQATGLSKKQFEKLIIEHYLKFPNYLFAQYSYARINLIKGNWQMVAKVFNNVFNIHDLFPGRDEFHITEFLTFNSIIGEYFSYMGDFEQAKVYFDMISQIDTTSSQYNNLLNTMIDKFPNKMKHQNKE